ncbi:hypothetical protein F0415_11775 [Arenimonas fontis]|uniref:Uncharacterized protein n=1 Tax=Arenimonas fontis TaxID=2608255 RepID=A0A5B2Z7Q0_9GAMM|nr:hypothetical protein F0415_11775 [Arenimonas fontis]
MRGWRSLCCPNRSRPSSGLSAAAIALVRQIVGEIEHSHGTRALPEHVREEFDEYLCCRTLEHGFLRVVCEIGNAAEHRLDGAAAHHDQAVDVAGRKDVLGGSRGGLPEPRTAAESRIPQTKTPNRSRLGAEKWWRKANEKEAHHVRVLRDPRRRAAVLQSIRGE